MMPDIDGFEVLEMIRQVSSVPVIMLTAKGEEDDRVRGLELGADDYITKPFSPRELVSRVKAVLRRTEGATGSMHGLIEVDDRLRIDFDRREIWLEGKLVKLRPTEYRLLYHLVQNAGWVVSHDQLLQKVWGYEYRDEPHYVRLYINYLRQKLEKDPADPKYILTERGVGYRFVDFRRDKAGDPQRRNADRPLRAQAFLRNANRAPTFFLRRRCIFSGGSNNRHEGGRNVQSYSLAAHARDGDPARCHGSAL